MTALATTAAIPNCNTTASTMRTTRACARGATKYTLNQEQALLEPQANDQVRTTMSLLADTHPSTAR
ncbi:hypothetical protein BAUCODRAFT_39083 [Baudoinia panamericana UAMH 10762]|uniref:Uncharacterized protein n=1 Tax=Baudoinia panamericana (strain UAMH 10762) TaxID=717646 RepID=M2M5N0_BAUPA|nr:uncharacterized protein BAUCODRAFT_39083 [Baudoinia panamericana UAMH 10762]EMC91941.1 hypothetical protein BAUCODRAFT_39083 [Baudoinia panamericana UAMH 10762]